MRKLASIRTIESLSPIEGADKIELAHTGGWQCVVGKDQFKPGEAAVFFEIDSALDPNDERYAFLKPTCLKEWRNKDGQLVDSCIRIRTMRFRGQISQGLFMPISVFPEVVVKDEGTDLTEVLHVRHFDLIKEQADTILGKVKLAGDIYGSFPSALVPKTDEERLQNLMEYFETKKDVAFECTEKFDGCSATFGYSTTLEEPFFVCGRNNRLKDTGENLYWRMARKYDLPHLLEQCSKMGTDLAIQAEIVGPGVNGNRDQYTEHEIRVFRIYDMQKQQWLTPEARHAFCARHKLPHVKIVRDNWEVFKEFTSLDDFLKFVEGKTDRGHEREGMVWKSLNGRISFKVINNNYLLKEK